MLGQLGEQVSVLYLPSGFGDWARRYHVLALPMQHEERLIGVIYVFRPSDAGGFSDRDLHVLDVFARQAAGALQQGQATADMLAEKTRLEEMQNTFVSIVSHELQTPVAIIKSYAATLAREDASWPAETIQRVSRNIEEECDRLTRLISDLLDLSRIQAGRVAMRVGSVDLPQLVAEVIDQLAPRSPRHSLRSSFPAPSRSSAATPTSCAGPCSTWSRTRSSTARTAARWSSRAKCANENTPLAVVRVIDQGIGIPPGEEERIFERFHRADTRLSRSTAGVGLGLYITRSIVEGHGGRIWAESPAQAAGPCLRSCSRSRLNRRKRVAHQHRELLRKPPPRVRRVRQRVGREGVVVAIARVRVAHRVEASWPGPRGSGTSVLAPSDSPGGLTQTNASTPANRRRLRPRADARAVLVAPAATVRPPIDA